VNFALVLRKIGGNLFTDKSVRQITDLQRALDRVVICDRDQIKLCAARSMIDRTVAELKEELAAVGT